MNAVAPGSPSTIPPPAGKTSFLATLRNWARDPSRRAQWLISALSALWFTLLLLYWSGGSLLYRIDFPGVYSMGGFLLFPSADYVIPALAAGVSFGDIYFAQYLSLFVDVFLCTLGAQLLARELFRTTFTRPQLLGVQFLAATFYLINPYNVTWGYYALTTNFFLHNAAFFLVMTLFVRLVRSLLTKRSFRWSDAAWLGVGLGLAAPTSFPNLARILVIEGIAFIVIALLALALFLSDRANRAGVVRAAKRFGLVSLPVSVVLIAYPFYLFLTNWLLQPSAISSVAAKSALLLRPNSYNTLPNVIRLIGRAHFTRFPYYQLYVSNPWVIAGTWLWPVLAIAVPLLLTLSPRIRDRAWIWAAELVLAPCIIWGTGLDPPFGPFNRWAVGLLPFGRNFMPPFFPVQLIAVKLYSVLAAFSVVVLYVAIARWRSLPPTSNPNSDASTATGRPSRARRWRFSRRGSERRGIAAVAVAVVIVALLFAGAAVILDGSILEVQKGGRGGFFVPAAYFKTRTVLDNHRANALTLPAMGIYIRTSWGYSGVTGFYSEFYYPSKVVVPAYYGPYKDLLTETRLSYAAATQGIMPGTNTTGLPVTSWPRWIQYQVSSDYHVYPFRPALNISSYAWVDVAIPTSNPALLLGLVAKEKLVVGLRTNEAEIGWYIIGLGGESMVVASNASSVELGLLVHGPTRGHYDPTFVGGLALRFPAPGDFPLLGLGKPTATGVSNSSLRPGWLSSIESTYHASYILIDFTLLYGREQPQSYALEVVATLAANGEATAVVTTPELQLWQLT